MKLKSVILCLFILVLLLSSLILLRFNPCINILELMVVVLSGILFYWFGILREEDKRFLFDYKMFLCAFLPLTLIISAIWGQEIMLASRILKSSDWRYPQILEVIRDAENFEGVMFFVLGITISASFANNRKSPENKVKDILSKGK